MFDDAPAKPATDRPDFRFAERLSRQIAQVGGRLADCLATLDTGQNSALADAQGFLDSLYQAWAAEAETEAVDLASPPHPLDRLVAALRLTGLEIQLLLLAAMPEEHEGYASILRSLHPRGEARASVGLAVRLFCENWRERMRLREVLLTGAAVRHGLLTLTEDGSFFEKGLGLADGLWPVLQGIEAWPKSLAPLALDASSAGLEGWLNASEVRRALRALRHPQPRTILICADSETIASQRAAVLVAQAGLPSVAFELHADTPAGTDRLALLHVLARGAVPIFKISLAGERSLPAGLLEVADFPGVAIICCRRGDAVPASGLPMLALSAEPLPASARQQLWRETLPELGGQAATLAARYSVEPAAAAQIAVDVRAVAMLDGAAMDLDMVCDSVRARSMSALIAGVQVIRPNACWEHLILPAERKAQLAAALQRLLHQAKVLEEWRFLEGRPGARGVRILMAGPPGTGKTLSAEVMAKALGVDLLVADISRIVSKWIGETEKNLAGIFDLAERAQAVLLFDEADALFGKRTEVSDAHDRYANLETAYLLSRIERFEGLTMLSTNLKQNIDPAFLRRLEFVIDFDEPAAAEREALWRCHLPPTAPLSDGVNLAELATLYPVVGGLIRNASVAAAFAAAAAGSPITREHLIGAIRREYEKSGKAFPGLPVGMSLN